MPEKTSEIPLRVLGILRCPACRARLDKTVEGLACVSCGQKFPRINGTIKFVDAQQYAGSFGFQWHKYSRTQLDDEISHASERAFRERTGFSPEMLRGKLVLDVGCGMGRFAEVASRWGASVVGIDLSRAAEVAAKNLAQRPEVAIFQADLFTLPFAPECFDFIYSIGVLHHTPSCEQAFKALPQYLKPEGSIAIWVYSGYGGYYKFSDLYRKVTTRLPEPFLHKLCYGAVPLYYVHRFLELIPLVGRPASRILQFLIPSSPLPDRHWRVLDTFDWYSPKYQSKHTYEEVFRWFESCGLRELRVLYESVGVAGTKPISAEKTLTESAPCAESRAL